MCDGLDQLPVEESEAEMKATTVREWMPATEGRYVEHEYTDEEIEDLFQPESGCLVMALLRRAQEAERRVDELERRQS